MERSIILDELRKLSEISVGYEKAQLAVKDAKSDLEKAKNYQPSRLTAFDQANKKKFIVDQVGASPKPLGKWNPLNLSKKKREAAQDAISEYERQARLVEKSYYKQNENARESLKREDDEDKANRINEANRKLAWAEEKCNLSKSGWELDTLLSERLRNSETINEIIVFFEDGRVDTMKEAVNLFYDERRKNEEARLAAEHRDRVETAIEQQNIAIQEAVDKVDRVSINVDEALRLAREAIDRADETYSRAEEAVSNSGY